MIRYISENQIDLQKLKQARKKLQLKHYQSIRNSSQINQQLNSSVQALKQLKKINDQKQLLKGRLSVLQIQQQKNDYKAWLNNEKYRFHEQMREQLQRERQIKKRHQQKILNKINENKAIAKQQKTNHQIILNRAKEQLLKQKQQQYKSKKEQSLNIQRQIQYFKKDDLSLRKIKKMRIQELQKIQKQNLSIFLSQKKNKFKINDDEDARKISRIKQQKLQQIQGLTKLENQMLERQARSKATYQQSRLKLKQLLQKKKKKQTSTTNSYKLPSINPQSQRKNVTQTDILIV